MTVEEIAAEMGIDLATAKPEGVTKLRTFVNDANTRYSEAGTLAAQAQANLAKVKEEQDAINQHIERYGESEAANAALRANYAAMEAQLKSLKESGVAIELPSPLPKPAAGGGPAAFDPDKFRGSVSSVITQSINLNNKYQTLFGKPLSEDIDVLASEAQKAGKSLYDYGAGKFDFAGEEKRKADAAAASHDADVAAKAVAAYREKNPNMGGNPDAAPGSESRFAQIAAPRKAGDWKTLANLSPREKIAASVRASREAIVASQA